MGRIAPDLATIFASFHSLLHLFANHVCDFGSMGRKTDRQFLGSESMFRVIGTRSPESPTPSRVLIAIGPGTPPRGQLHVPISACGFRRLGSSVLARGRRQSCRGGYEAAVGRRRRCEALRCRAGGARPKVLLSR